MLQRLSLMALLILVASILDGGTLTADPLEKRSRVELQMGLWLDLGTSAEISYSGVVTETESEGLLGGIAYSRWLREELAMIVSVGLLALDLESRVGSGGVTTRTAVVSPLLFGVRYYFPESSFGGDWRPYAAVAVGPYIGNQSTTQVGAVTLAVAETRAAFGGRLGMGLDVQLSRLFMMGVAGGYHLMTDFSGPIGERVNYSGPELAVSISLLFGAGAR